jgi:hypothetical protein
MQKRTRSILEELDQIYNDRHGQRDQKYLLESRAVNVINSAIRIIEQIDKVYPGEQSENLQRKLLNAIRLKDPAKFTKSVRRTDNQGS